MPGPTVLYNYYIASESTSSQITSGNDVYDDTNAGRAINTALIDGSTGDDTLSGFEGDDFIIGNAGNDQMTGGTGADTFAFKFEYHAATQTWVDGVSHTETFTLGHPSANADWKAWDEYEHRLVTFFGGNNASVQGSLEWYQAQGYVFGANVLSLNANWDAAGVGSSGPTTAIAGFSEVDLTNPKINNTKGADLTKNHDFDNNAALANSTGAAGKFGFLYADVSGVKTVVDSEGHYNVTPESFSSTDGADQVTDFKLADGDALFLGVKGGALTEQQFYDNFTSVKDADGHGVTVSLDAGGWSVHVKLDGVDPQGVGVNGHDWSNFDAVEIEHFVWNSMIDQTPTLAGGAAWQTYVDGWIAA